MGVPGGALKGVAVAGAEVQSRLIRRWALHGAGGGGGGSAVRTQHRAQLGWIQRGATLGPLDMTLHTTCEGTASVLSHLPLAPTPGRLSHLTLLARPQLEFWTSVQDLAFDLPAPVPPSLG